MSILQTTDLKKYYGTEPNITKALDGVTLSIEQGEFVAIVGTSGSGKSTLLNIMGGLDVPTSGSVQIKGKELSELICCWSLSKVPAHRCSSGCPDCRSVRLPERWRAWKRGRGR